MLMGASRRSPLVPVTSAAIPRCCAASGAWSRSEITTVGFTDTREQVGDLGGDGAPGRR